MGFDANGAETGIWVDASTQTKGIGSNAVSYTHLDVYKRQVQDFSAVTGACLLVKTSVWDEVKGLDEAFAVASRIFLSSCSAPVILPSREDLMGVATVSPLLSRAV